MAMAAIRFAARRLTSQQQQQPILRSAVLNHGGSPAYALRQFTSSEASAATGSKISTEHTSVSGDSRLMAAHQKKEELFDLLTEIQMNKDIPRTIRMMDRRLLQRLSTHVDRRSSNPEWHQYRREHAINHCLRGLAAFLAFLYMLEKWSLFFARNKQVQGTDSVSKATVSCPEEHIEK